MILMIIDMKPQILKSAVFLLYLQKVYFMGKDRTKENLKMLDNIDFLKFFEESPMSVSDLVKKVEDAYANTEFTNNDVMEGWVFNWVGNSELCDYLEERYPNFRHYEVCNEYCYLDD